ncbi:alpha-amylase family glycosyl hydrolase [Gracilimonas sediminicola]|uniref:Alpha-amylase family glycosyl hydrolase n=1 Tax=Gracilimonas sediminicola TaxID=2952158 RepID=A0A9X2L5U3_9BACT|nr:alpha-amylase family glycosyl hydrolase [Gracilimonas sediminicola]MCP9292935.1 alpha-amylase family glycosyl hydrolase [Gracilimonas sediminicola]
MKKFINNLLPVLLALSVIVGGCNQPKQNSDKATVSSVEQLEWSKNSSIYEINVRQYSEEGTFEAVRKDLPRIREMGVRILWLMPIHPIGEKNRKGPLGSYYSVQDYKDVNPNFGTKADFARFVDEAHQLGFKVIIDWVANHTAWDNPWTENPEWYELNEEGNFMPPRGTDWSDVIQLDYENEEMRAAMTDALEYWVREFDIDGYRCDVAGMVPTDFWKEAIDSLNTIKPVFMLAEDGEPELVKEAFHMNYAWQYAHTIREIAAGHQTFQDLDSLMQASEANFPSSSYRMYFTSNHDENSWNGTDPQMYGDNFENFAVLSATIDGMPLIYNGQESGLDKQLEFFEKDPIEWKEYKYQDFYTTLVGLKRDTPALWNGDFGGDLEFIRVPEGSEGVLAYKRQKNESEVVVVLNFSSDRKSVPLSEVGVDESYTTYNSTSLMVTSQEISFGPNQWVIFVK